MTLGSILKSNKTLYKYRVPKRPTNYDFTHFDADQKKQSTNHGIFPTTITHVPTVKTA
jgi:hypothetical protein